MSRARKLKKDPSFDWQKLDIPIRMGPDWRPSIAGLASTKKELDAVLTELGVLPPVIAPVPPVIPPPVPVLPKARWTKRARKWLTIRFFSAVLLLHSPEYKQDTLDRMMVLQRPEMTLASQESGPWKGYYERQYDKK